MQAAFHPAYYHPQLVCLARLGEVSIKKWCYKNKHSGQARKEDRVGQIYGCVQSTPRSDGSFSRARDLFWSNSISADCLRYVFARKSIYEWQNTLDIFFSLLSYLHTYTILSSWPRKPEKIQAFCARRVVRLAVDHLKTTLPTNKPNQQPKVRWLSSQKGQLKCTFNGRDKALSNWKSRWPTCRSLHESRSKEMTLFSPSVSNEIPTRYPCQTSSLLSSLSSPTSLCSAVPCEQSRCMWLGVRVDVFLDLVHVKMFTAMAGKFKAL